MGRSYLSHIKYRLGAYYTTPYYKIGGKEATRECGVTAGFGLPVPRSRSILRKHLPREHRIDVQRTLVLQTQSGVMR